MSCILRSFLPIAGSYNSIPRQIVIRTCKKIKLQLDEIEEKRRGELEKLNPENRLREILGAEPTSHQEQHKPKNPNAPMPIWGDGSTFNMNEILRNNIKSSQFFSDLQNYRSFHEVIEQLAAKATHAEPWATSGSTIPSPLFCCLYKFMLMRLSGNNGVLVIT